MSARKVEQNITARHPRETTAWFGHHDAEMALLDAYRSGRIPHAWLIGGAQGIGKATLAYRMARFVLAHRNPLAPGVQRAETLSVDPSDPAARHVAAGAHGGLLTLERTPNEKGVMRTFIVLDQDSGNHPLFRLDRRGGGLAGLHRRHRRRTQSAGCERAVEDSRGAAAAIAVPSVSHAPARLLPTILSRCRKLPLRPLSTEDVIRAAAAAANIAIDDPALAEAAEARKAASPAR